MAGAHTQVSVAQASPLTPPILSSFPKEEGPELREGL